jgi:hypothetical protein
MAAKHHAVNPTAARARHLRMLRYVVQYGGAL